ncbi:MAG: hypothetical protein M3O61_14175, partial [Gemmatimonadota bacterium]|nr:hypothetical protein [Gemmatimonadota bacterium]
MSTWPQPIFIRTIHPKSVSGVLAFSRSFPGERNMSHRILTAAALAFVAVSASCLEQGASTGSADSARDSSGATQSVADRMAKYTTVALVADTAPLTLKERQMIPLLIQAAQAMDSIYWIQSYGNRDSLIASVNDARMKQFIDINYGPWDRLDNNAPFVPGVGARPPGANLYPHEITKAEFDSAATKGPAARADSLKSLYTMVRRAAGGGLEAVPYNVVFKTHNEVAAAKLREAAVLAEDAGLRRYLAMRADALVTDNYQPSD